MVADEDSPNNTTAPTLAVTDTLSDVSSSTSSDEDDGHLSTSMLPGEDGKSKEETQRRLVVWNVEMLSRLLRKIVAMREGKEPEKENIMASMFTGIMNSMQAQDDEYLELPAPRPGQTVLDEVQEIIALPTEAAAHKQEPDLVELPSDVVDQLTKYVTAIADMYRDNPFHSFDHASHVTQSVIKMLSRVVAVHEVDYGNMTYKNIHDNHEQHHDNTYGIVSMTLALVPCPQMHSPEIV